jgi:hypothetical protein
MQNLVSDSSVWPQAMQNREPGAGTNGRPWFKAAGTAGAAGGGGGAGGALGAGAANAGVVFTVWSAPQAMQNRLSFSSAWAQEMQNRDAAAEGATGFCAIGVRTVAGKDMTGAALGTGGATGAFLSWFWSAPQAVQNLVPGARPALQDTQNIDAGDVEFSPGGGGTATVRLLPQPVHHMFPASLAVPQRSQCMSSTPYG